MPGELNRQDEESNLERDLYNHYSSYRKAFRSNFDSYAEVWQRLSGQLEQPALSSTLASQTKHSLLRRFFVPKLTGAEQTLLSDQSLTEEKVKKTHTVLPNWATTGLVTGVIIIAVTIIAISVRSANSLNNVPGVQPGQVVVSTATPVPTVQETPTLVTDATATPVPTVILGEMGTPLPTVVPYGTATPLPTVTPGGPGGFTPDTSPTSLPPTVIPGETATPLPTIVPGEPETRPTVVPPGMPTPTPTIVPGVPSGFTPDSNRPTVVPGNRPATPDTGTPQPTVTPLARNP